TLGNGEEPELLRDDLSLLGDLEPAIHRARRECGERAIDRRSAAAPDAATATMEEPKLNARIGEESRQRLLPLVERPRRGEDAGVLPRVGVADHHLLLVPARRELLAVERILE